MTSFSDKIQRGWARAFHTSVLQDQRWQWVDYLKGIAILLVVYRHVLIGIERSGGVIPQPLVDANMIFFSFRMPLFFILSGLFIGGSLARKATGTLVRQKFDTLLYPYLIWTFIQVSLQVFLSAYTNSDRSWIDYTYIFYQPRNLDQFWYLPALFNATLVFVLLERRFRPGVYGHLLLGLVLYVLAPFAEAVSMISDWMAYYLFFALGHALAPLFFREGVQQRMQQPWVLAAMVPLFVGAQVYYLSGPAGPVEYLLVALIGCASMFVLAFCLQRWKVLSFFRILGYHSLYIYVMHVLASAFVRICLTRLLGVQDPVVLLATGIFFGLLLPIIVYNLLIRKGPLWFLFSPHRPKAETKAVQEPARKAVLVS